MKIRRYLKSTVRAFLPRRCRAHRILSGPLVGRRIVTSWRDYPAAILGYGEKALTSWLISTARAGETWLDIGAHYGYTSLALCEAVGEHGRVYAFEPSGATAGCLAKTRMVNRYWWWTVCPLGLDDTSAIHTQDMPLWRGMIDSQLLASEADGSERFLAVGLSAIWPSIAGKNVRIDGVKIDVQGMELAVISGAMEVLKAHRPKLVVEVHSGVSRLRLKELLGEAGYALLAEPVEPDAPALEDESGNASYVFYRK